ncbi:MAG: T9SS type A sorting domain-containing protein [Bacteroidia bacterium]|nr:T9SS type A sorting domain-containing protein [Bacteroidia bacterium]
MKKNYKKLMSFGLGLFLAGNVFSQAFTQSFDDITTLPADGWVTNNLSSPVGTVPNWVQGAVGGVFDPNSGTGFIQGNYNLVAGANTISCWLISPDRIFNNGDIITFFTRTVNAPSYADRLQVRLSTNGASTNVGATSTSVGDFTTLLLEINPTLTTTGYPNTWTQYSITISGLGAPTSGRVAFRYFVTNGGPSGTNSDNIGIDDFVYTPAGGAAANVTTSASGEYTLIPFSQVSAMPLVNRVNNIGTAATTDAVLTAKVYLAPNFTTPIQTATSTGTSIAVGANALINTGSTFTPSVVGSYLIQYASSCTNNTVTSADTTNYFFAVTDSTYARDNGTVVGGLGIGAGNGGYLGQDFEITSATNITSVTAYYTRGYTGRPYSLSVWNTAAGVPSTIVANTDTLLYPNDSARLATISIHGGFVALTPGRYVVTANEFANDSTIQIGNTNSIFTTGKIWVNWPTIPTGNWTNVETFGANFSKPFVIRPNFGCVPTTFTQSPSVCAGGSVTVGTNTYTISGTYTDILTAANGCDSIVTTNLTVANAIDVTTALSDVTITANGTGTYQWIDCDNANAIISGETAQSFTATASGNYAVIVTVGACADTSSCVNVIVLGIDNHASAGMLSVYPNPSTGTFVVRTAAKKASYSIYNELGQVVRTVELTASNNYSTTINDLANGVYTISGIVEGKVVKQRIVINK